MEPVTFKWRLNTASFISSPAFWLFAVAFGVRLFVLSRLSATPYFLPDAGDMKFYSDWGLRIAHGTLTDSKAFYGLPGYAYLLAAIYTLIGFDPFAVGVVQSVSEALIAVVIYRIGEAVFATHPAQVRWMGALAALGWIFFQPAQTFSAILMPTTWLVLVYWSCILWLLNIKACSVWRPWLWIGVLIGVVAMMIATVLFLVPLVVAAIICHVARGEPALERWAKVAAASCFVVVGIYAGSSPCWLHNHLIAKEPVMLSAHSGINFYIGNNPIANGYPKIPPGMRAGQEGMLKDSITMAELAAGHSLKRVEVSRYWSARAKDYIHSNFRAWLLLMATKFKNFWNAFQYDDLSLVTLFSQSRILTPGLRFGFIAALAIPGMILAGFRVKRSRWVIAAILLHMCALMPVFITERYRMAAVPGLLLMASYGLFTFWHALNSSKWLATGLYVALAAASTFFVSLPQSDPGLWSLDYYNAGIKAIAAGDLERAQHDLEIAYAYVPDNSEINFALGNLWWKKRDFLEARLFASTFVPIFDPYSWMQARQQMTKYYRKAYLINTNHGAVRNNLAVLAMEEENWAYARKFLDEALRIDPNDATTQFLSAKACYKCGDFQGAQLHIQKAVQLKPQEPAFQRLFDEIASHKR